MAEETSFFRSTPLLLSVTLTCVIGTKKGVRHNTHNLPPASVASTAYCIPYQRQALPLPEIAFGRVWFERLKSGYSACTYSFLRSRRLSMASVNTGLGLNRYKNLLVVIKQTAYEEYSQVSFKIVGHYNRKKIISMIAAPVNFP